MTAKQVAHLSLPVGAAPSARRRRHHTTTLPVPPTSLYLPAPPHLPASAAATPPHYRCRSFLSALLLLLAGAAHRSLPAGVTHLSLPVGATPPARWHCHHTVGATTTRPVGVVTLNR
jgi:hypothetical protein